VHFLGILLTALLLDPELWVGADMMDDLVGAGIEIIIWMWFESGLEHKSLQMIL
jgi:hypothetical protein